MLRKMCRSLQARVPEHLAAVRDALHDQDALRLREAAHKFYGMLSAFSTVAGDQAADLEDLAARGLLQEALPVVEQLDRVGDRTRPAGRRAHDRDSSASWRSLPQTPTGQPAPETAGRLRSSETSGKRNR